MESEIKKLWNGNIQPCVGCGKENYDINCTLELIEKIGEKLQQNLSEEQKKTFERFNSNMEEYISLMTEQAFFDGFALGSRIMTEVFYTE